MIAVRPLMLARPVAEVSGRAVGGHRAFADAGHCRGVVGAVHESGVADVVGRSHEVHLAEETRVLEVAVGDGAGGVVGGHEAPLDVGRERVAPEVALAGVVEVHPAHACLGGVGAPEEAGVLRDNFGEEGGPVFKAGREAGEGVDVEPEVAVDAHSVPLGTLEGQLEGAEEAGQPGDGY